MLTIDKVVVRRGENVLRYDFSLDIGKTLAIQGRSGIGKSTLLDAIAGFLAPEQGDILWQGDSLLPLPANKRPVSQLFQEHNLFEHLSIMQNLQLGLREHELSVREQLITHAALELEVHDLLARQPHELSGGQRQRIALLRTLLRPEPLVLLDEPFTGLDGESRKLASDWVAQTASDHQKTVLLVTHHGEDVQRLADHTLDLGSGIQ